MSGLTVGIQGGEGSFHHEAAIQYFGADSETRYQSFTDHEALVRNLFDPTSELHDAIVAIDNNTSGRVLSAIDSLKKQSGIKVVGSITAGIIQRLLLYPGHEPADVEAVISQQPALDQCEANIQKAGYIAIPYSDTAEAARRISISRGHYQGYNSVAAIGSRKAGELHGLELGPEFNDQKNNATKFWVLSDSMRSSQGTNSAMTFEVPNRAGQLYRAISIISIDHGFNIVDLDSHIASDSDTGRAFFAEVTHEDSDLAGNTLLEALESAGFKPQHLGSYTPKGEELLIVDGNHHVPDALNHDEWEGRHGLDHPEGSGVLYVETDHNPGALYKVLGHLAACNLVDLGRPIVPKDHKFNRGFYFVTDPRIENGEISDAIKSINSLEGFSAERVKHE